MSRYLKKDDRNYGELLLENIELRQKNIKLEEALKIYADKDNWVHNYMEDHFHSEVIGHNIFLFDTMEDGWTIAQEALKCL
uniref:Uncharacterized protein n=1 Tax=viral metagenome TaxID=1070528 RepID=A0A6M3KWF1_9ZZZZ